MAHQGKMLEREINLGKKTITDIALQTGISRQTIYNLYHKETITHEYKEMFKKVGINIAQENVQLSKNDLSLQSKNSIDKIVESFTKALDALAEDNKFFKAELKEAYHELKEANKAIRTYMVDKAPHQRKVS